MKKIFFAGIIGLFLFELLKVYFIMPFPGSQKMESINVAYFLFSWRWLFRIFFIALTVFAFLKAKWKSKWVPGLIIILFSILVFAVNFKMAADHMFYQTSHLSMKEPAGNKVDPSQIVIGIERNGEAKAYPVQYIGYHHQVLDSLNGDPIIVTYCTVCRTGRIYEPKVKGKYDVFRLVGMDHFNAMFEDASTKSWWRQVNGVAIAGNLKGESLPELLSTQTSLSNWLSMYPASKIMQPDSFFLDQYASLKDFESGKSKSNLVGTDTSSWKDKSWVVGIKVGGQSKAYDWNKLKRQRIIHDSLNEVPVLLILTADDKSFFALERPSNESQFTMKNDTLYQGNSTYRLDGKGIGSAVSLKRLPAYQEFWHSWRTFNQGTKVY